MEKGRGIAVQIQKPCNQAILGEKDAVVYPTVLGEL
jgi:hypothetical protein